MENCADVDETDLELVSALQDAPRAGWSDLAEVLGLGQDALAHRWRRLERGGLAWVSLVDDQSVLTRCHTFLLLSTHPGQQAFVAEELKRLPEVLTLHRIGGSYDLSVLLRTVDMAGADEVVRVTVGGIRGVASMRLLPVIGVISSGSAWRTTALGPGEREKLRSLARQGRGELPPVEIREDAVLRAIISDLARDGRAGPSELTRHLRDTHGLEISVSTVSRRLAQILRTMGLQIRCDISAPDMGWHAVVMLWGQVDAEAVVAICQEGSAAESTAHRLVPELRSLLVLAGPVNFHATLWLHRLDALPEAEARLTTWIPSLRVEDRSVVYETPKRMGWHLVEGRRVGAEPRREEAE